MRRNVVFATTAAAALLLAGLALLQPGVVDAQVVREDGISSFAGVLDSADTSDTFKFNARKGDLLHADLDSDVYELVGRDDGHHEMAAIGGEHPEGEDCGGPGGLVIEVLSASGDIVCWADRPTRPGWQRDPAMHCYFTEDGTYRLRIGLSEHDPHTHAAELTPSEPLGNGLVPYLANVSLRAEAPEGLLNRAIARSDNRLP